MKHALLLLVLLAAQARAQIIYTDVVPDQTFLTISDTCFLDLDNDGTIDFLIRYHTWGVACPYPCSGTRQRNSVTITPMANNAVVDTLLYASQLQTLRSIDTTLTWNNTGGQYLLIRGTPGCHQFGLSHVCLPGGFTGQWIGGTSETSPKFLGLRFDSAGSTFYGWARLSIPSSGASFTLKDYAYNSTPDELILAGDTGVQISTGIAQLADRAVQVIPNPSSGKFTVHGLERSGAIDLEIRNAMGQEILRSTFNNARSEIDLSSQPSGVYILTIRTAGQVISRKLIKE